MERTRLSSALARVFCFVAWPAAWAVVGIGALAWSSALTDGLLWRFEGLEKGPRLSQRAHERLSLAEHRAPDALLSAGTVVVLGDSHLSSVPASLLGQAHNFAIGGQSAVRLAERVPHYRSLARAASVVLGAGTNDLVEGVPVSDTLQAWERMLAAMPAHVPVLCIGIPEPVGEGDWPQGIQSLNQGVEDRCRARGYRFMAVTPGRGAWADAPWATDGIHLSAEGTRLLALRIRALLSAEVTA